MALGAGLAVDVGLAPGVGDGVVLAIGVGVPELLTVTPTVATPTVPLLLL